MDVSLIKGYIRYPGRRVCGRIGWFEMDENVLCFEATPFRQIILRPYEIPPDRDLSTFIINVERPKCLISTK